MNRSRAFWLVVIAGLAAVAPVLAQEPYPSRPITIVAPFPPGGVADLTARPVAAAMEKVLKNPVGVVNKTGAAGAVGMQFVATSKPDGYTLLLALSSISIIPEADKLFGRPPAFTVDQFAPIALISADPTILVVPADKPWKTAADFIEDAKKRPGQISYSSSGSSFHFTGHPFMTGWSGLMVSTSNGRRCWCRMDLTPSTLRHSSVLELR